VITFQTPHVDGEPVSVLGVRVIDNAYVIECITPMLQIVTMYVAMYFVSKNESPDPLE